MPDTRPNPPFAPAYWEDRYAPDGYVFGTAPSQFLAAHAPLLKPGQSALLPADGEGRNSVFLAEMGLQVTAFDASPRGVGKARALAASRGVEVDFRLGDIDSWDWDAAQYDVVAGIFFQFAPPEMRARIFAGMIRATAPGGLILLHGYTPKQLDFGTGGPGKIEHLYTPELLQEAFAGQEILELRAYETELDEGQGHSGPSALIDMVARRMS